MYIPSFLVLHIMSFWTKGAFTDDDSAHGFSLMSSEINVEKLIF